MDRTTNSEIRRTVGDAVRSETESSNDFASLAVCRKIEYLPVVVSYRSGRALLRSCSFESVEYFQVRLSEELQRLQTGTLLNPKDTSTLEQFVRHLQQKDPMSLGEVEIFLEWVQWQGLLRSGAALVKHSADTCLTIAVALATPQTVAGFLSGSKSFTQSNVAEAAHDLNGFYSWLRHQVAFGLPNPAAPVIAAITQTGSSATRNWRQELKKL